MVPVVDIAGVKFQHAQAVLLVDHHHFRFAQQDIVHFDIQRLPGEFIQLNHRVVVDVKEVG